LLNSAEKLLLIISSMALSNVSLTEGQQNCITIWGLFRPPVTSREAATSSSAGLAVRAPLCLDGSPPKLGPDALLHSNAV
jgi:hypothetical protein